IRDLHVSMPLLYRGAANSLSQLMADLLGLIALLIIVIVRAPAVGLSLTVFLVAAAQLYNRVIRSRISLVSMRIQSGNHECLTDLSESFGGLKTLKAFRVEDSAVRRFARTRSRFALTARDAAVFSQISRYYLDVAT